jgi:hypothetical protein
LVSRTVPGLSFDCRGQELRERKGPNRIPLSNMIAIAEELANIRKWTCMEHPTVIMEKGVSILVR